MKQGKASYQGQYGHKVEPKSRAISPAWTNEMGVAYGTHNTDGSETSGGQSPMTTGPGLRAPMQSQKSHKSGSQGQH